MKKLLVFLCAMIVFDVASATTTNLNWLVEGNTYAQTTCESGADLILPTNPTKRGYHFVGWTPTSYTRLDYIESTGTQYIDTGYPVNDNVSVKMKIMRLDNSQALTLFGYRFVDAPSASGNMRFVFVYPDGRVGLRTGVSATNSTQSLSLNQDYVIEYALNSIKVNNVEWVSSSQSYTTTSFGDGYLLYANVEGYASSDVYKFVGRIYYFEERDNGTLVRNMIPVKRDTDNVVGMYDTISKTFFTNAGTGNFVAGPISATQTLE